MSRKVADNGTLPVNVGAWLEELVRLGKKNDAGHTTRELAVIWRIEPKNVRERLRQAQALGRLVVGRRSAPGIDGRSSLVPVYTIRPNTRAAERK